MVDLGVESPTKRCSGDSAPGNDEDRGSLATRDADEGTAHLARF